nr:LPS assembly protein LptD [Hyphomicrobium sp.]
PFVTARVDVASVNTSYLPASYQFGPTFPGQNPLQSGSDDLIRAMPAVGLDYKYPFISAESWGTQTIEPRAQVIIRPNESNIGKFPNEDAQSLVFDDTNLFSTSKFSGYDRIETGTRVNAGLQYTFQSKDGGYARFLAGQSYHLSGDNIYLNPGRNADGNYVFNPYNGLQTDRSDYVLGAYLAPLSNFRIISQSRFDQATFALKRMDSSMITSWGPLSVQAGYSYDAEAIFSDPDQPYVIAPLTSQEEVLAAATLQLTNRWSIGGSSRYNLQEGNFRYDSINLKYVDDCFALTASYIQSNYSDLSITPDQTIMLRFEFKHLGDFATSTGAGFNLGGDQRTN